MNHLSLYIHIPFCKQKCNYCDFASYTGKETLMNAYFDAVTKEIKDLKLKTKDQAAPIFNTIYIGGGTPTLVAFQLYEKLFQTIRQVFIISSDAEITIEANPGTINRHYLKAIRKIGINRISLGAQSFNDKHLKTLGRIHKAKQILQGVEDANHAGFDNVNLDLIFALPNQTFNEWKTDLTQALALQIQHLSTYNLQIEENTKFYELGDKLSLPKEEIEIAMYEYAITTLKTAGYHHYEISNFAQPGFESNHNLVYWKNKNYLGVGAAASSHINGNRHDNPRNIEKYIKSKTQRSKFNFLSQKNQPDQSETIFMGLRLLDGLKEEKFIGFEKTVYELISEGLLKKQANKIKLTHRGLLLANEVFKKFI